MREMTRNVESKARQAEVKLARLQKRLEVLVEDLVHATGNASVSEACPESSNHDVLSSV